MAKNRWLSLDSVWTATALTLLAVRPLLTALPPHDFWWHLAMGREIVARGSVPTVDLWTWTVAGTPFYDQAWGAQVLMYGLYRAGGVALLVLLQAIMIAASYGGLLWLMLRRVGREHLRLLVGVLLLTVVPISFDNWIIRPQSYAIPLFVGTLAVLTAYRLRWRNVLWLLPILIGVWANVHGTFMLGLALIGLTWLGEALKRWLHPHYPRWISESLLTWRALALLAGWGVLSGAATLLNPRGIGLLGYVLNLLGSSQVSGLVTEWQPPSFRSIYDILFFVVLALLLVALWRARRSLDLTDLMVMLPFVGLALQANRNILWFGLVMYAPLARAIVARRKSAAAPAFQGQPLLNGIVIGVLALLVVLALPWIKPQLGLPPEAGNLLAPSTPVGAVAYLRSLPAAERPQRLFHDHIYGSYLPWAAPDQRTFIDTRFELFPLALWDDYTALSDGQRVPALIQQYGIDGLLLNPQSQPQLVAYAETSPDWRIVWQGDGINESSVLFLPR